MIYVTYLLGRIIPAGIGLCTILMLSHLADPTTYGEYAVALAVSMILNLVFFQWNRSSVTRNSAHDPDDVISIVGASIALHFLNILIVIVLIISYGLLFNYSVASILMMTVVCSTSDFVLEIARATGKAKQYAFQYAVRQILFFFLSYFLLKYGVFDFGINLIVLSYLTSFSLSSLPYILIYIKKFGFIFSREYLLLHSRFGLPLVLNFSLSGFINQIDKLIVSAFLGKEAAGIYALAVDITKQTLLTLMEAVNLAAFPRLVKAYEAGDALKSTHKMQENLDVLVGVSLPATIGFIMILPSVSGTLIGQDFAKSFMMVAPLIACASFVRGLRVYYFDQAFHLTRETFKPAINSSVALLALVVLGLIGVRHLEVLGVSLAVLLSAILSCALSFGLGRGALRLPVDFWHLFICCVCTAIMAITVYLVGYNFQPGWTSALLQIITGAVVYVLCCLSLNYAGSRDLVLRRLRS